jgi:hypothetical protein
MSLLRPSWGWLVPLLLLTFWLGARSLDADAIWLDEYFSIYDSGGGAYGPLSPMDIWQRVGERNPWHAPGYFIILNLWERAVGAEPAALRALSLLFGVLAVAWTYALGRRLVSHHVALYAAVVLGTSAFFVYYLHEIRMYTLIAFLAAFALWVYLRLIDLCHEPTIWLWLGLLASAALLLYTHYLAAIPLVAIGLYHLLFVPKTRRWWQVVGVMALAGALFLPWVGSLVAGLGLATGDESLHDRALSTRQAVEKLAFLFSNGGVALFAAFAGLSLLAFRRGGWRSWFFPLVMLAVMLAINARFEIIPAGRIRYLLSLWPLLAIIVALGMAQLARWKPLPLLALVAWAGIGLWNVGNPGFTSDLASTDYVFPLHLIDDQLRAYGQAGDFVIDYLSDGMASITYDRTADFYFSRRGMRFDNIEMRANDSEQDVEEREALDIAASHPRVWLAYVPDNRPTGLSAFEARLAEGYTLCGAKVDEPALHLDLYARSPADCPM